ncbi:unannotated protein [freshwater metagenome]|uniref:Unannotated protein n=1 Tax=freshwater metagenome TaxID=449393 RepID=A0A6J7LSQ2_9ZZZZ
MAKFGSTATWHGYFKLFALIVRKFTFPNKSNTAETEAEVFKFGSFGLSNTVF